MSIEDEYGDDEFEWLIQKAAANWLDHGVSFAHATKVFRDVFVVEYLDDREDYEEERINIVGMCDGVLLHVTYTECGERRRLISARRAVRSERDDYYRQNAVDWD